ncbi:MAG TPA: FUSC family protein [Candidatus Micrarchaeia archaeon]|nr:FUSC family protein [Candidatus Micrarchaeia archaeon]
MSAAAGRSRPGDGATGTSQPTPVSSHPRPGPGTTALAPRLPWASSPAAFRSLRATLVIPSLFALTAVGIGDLQMATFAAFGGVATLVLAGFGGPRRRRLVAHLGLALAGSVLLTIGTAVSAAPWLAALVTVPVAFTVLFAGVAGPNAASGATAAMLAYVLPAASPGVAAMVPSRLAGWWLASLVGTAAVLLLSPRPPADRLRAAASASATALADLIAAALAGGAVEDGRTQAVAAERRLRAAFSAAPFRPTGLAAPDQALADLVETLEWCTALVGDAVSGADLTRGSASDRELVAAAGGVLRDVADVLLGGEAAPDLEQLERLRGVVAATWKQGPLLTEEDRRAVHLCFHARTVAVAVRAAAVDAMIVARRSSPETIAVQRRRWYGDLGADARAAGGGGRRLASLSAFAGAATRHASLRSVSFRNSLRGAAAVAAAVAVADLSGVQHGFWVVLAVLSVLRTNAASTGATALRALGGTAAGFVVGAALIVAIGTDTAVLWALLPVSVLVAAYTPGVAPFAVGQAAFTVEVSILYNLLVPVGWTVGVLRVQDVAIGCVLSVAVGALVWPRGAAAVVNDDIGDAYRWGAAYLTQAVAWFLGLREQPPDAAIPAVTAALRLDDALRGFLAEQGTKGVAKEELWRAVGGAMRLRLTAHSLAGLPRGMLGDPQRSDLSREAEQLSAWYQQLAAHTIGLAELPVALLEGVDGDAVAPAGGPGAAAPVPQPAAALMAHQHLRHLRLHLAEIVGPVAQVAAQAHRPLRGLPARAMAARSRR